LCLGFLYQVTARLSRIFIADLGDEEQWQGRETFFGRGRLSQGYSPFLWQIFTLNALQGVVIVLSLTKGKTGLKSSGVGASQRCGSGTPLKPHSLYRVFPF
jgi:hypothetical protein